MSTDDGRDVWAKYLTLLQRKELLIRDLRDALDYLRHAPAGVDYERAQQNADEVLAKAGQS